MSDSQRLIALEEALLDAHAQKDQIALVGLYSEAGDIKERGGAIDAACFYYTHAYVFALETGDVRQHMLLGKLVQYGRDAYATNDV
ncbi:MAG: hypothetical protein WBC71_08270 [Salaquimonas sp.]